MSQGIKIEITSLGQSALSQEPCVLRWKQPISWELDARWPCPRGPPPLVLLPLVPLLPESSGVAGRNQAEYCGQSCRYYPGSPPTFWEGTLLLFEDPEVTGLVRGRAGV